MKFLKIMGCLVLSSFILLSTCYAEYTANGITVKTSSLMGKKRFDAVIQSAFDPNNTIVYNSASGVALTSGAVRVGAYDELQVQINVTSLGSDGLSVEVEGIYGSDGNEDVTSSPQATASWATVYIKTFSAATATNKDFAFPISEKGLKWVRIGVKSTGTDGVDVVSVWLSGVTNFRW